MYKYFLGPKSNKDTKKINDPLVIEAETSVIHEIEMWLDKYGIDLDFFIDTIISVTHSNIIKINCDDTRIFGLQLENGNDSYVELLGIEQAKCKVVVQENEYVFVLKNEAFLESLYEVKNSIKCGFNKVDKQLLFGKEQTFLTIELEEYDDKFYDIMIKNLDKLSIWDNIACVLCWIKDLNLNIPSYAFSIVSKEEGYLGVNKLNVMNDRITSYIHINTHGQYQVDNDGTWKASHLGYFYNYDLISKKLVIGVPEKSMAHIILAQQFLEQVKDLVKTMQGTINVINNSLDEIKQINEEIDLS